MSSQRKNRGASRTDNAPQKIPGGMFASGLLTGVVLTLAVSAILPDGATSIDAGPAEAETPAPQQNSEFQFYTLLNEQEVVVPDNSASATPETEETVYGLQVASFRSTDDADALRAELILLNLDVEISTVNNQGMLWHRVMVGPFLSRTARASAMDTLINAGHRPLLIEWKRQLPTNP